MNEIPLHQPNPLARLARAVPSATGITLSLGARLAGVALAATIAVEQSYDRTRLFAVAVAALALFSCLPLSAGLRGRLAWLGAGLLFFGGALLAGLGTGLLVLLCGAVAATGAAIDEQHHRRRTDVPSFFMGFGITAGLVVLIVLAVEG
jgi:hypothetical protein